MRHAAGIKSVPQRNCLRQVINIILIIFQVAGKMVAEDLWFPQGKKARSEPMLKFRLAPSLLLTAEFSRASAEADAVLNFHVLFHFSEERSCFSAFYLVSEKQEILPPGGSIRSKSELPLFSFLTSQATCASSCSFRSVLAQSA